MKIEDLSAEVIQESINKWSKALATGWSQSLWNACAICDECSDGGV